MVQVTPSHIYFIIPAESAACLSVISDDTSMLYFFICCKDADGKSPKYWPPPACCACSLKRLFDHQALDLFELHVGRNVPRPPAVDPSGIVPLSNGKSTGSIRLSFASSTARSMTFCSSRTLRASCAEQTLIGRLRNAGNHIHVPPCENALKISCTDYFLHFSPKI